MKRAIVILFVLCILLSSCATTEAKKEKSLLLQAQALLLLETEEYGEAVELFDKAVQLAPKMSEGRYNLVLALLANKQFDEATLLCDESFSLFPAHLEFLLAKAYAYRQMGELDEAYKVYNEVLKRNRGDYPLHAKLMELAMQEGFTDFAGEVARYLLSVHQEEQRTFEVLALLAGEDSWYALASALMKEAEKEAPVSPQEQSK